jgi:hypothetical protein
MNHPSIHSSIPTSVNPARPSISLFGDIRIVIVIHDRHPKYTQELNQHTRHRGQRKTTLFKHSEPHLTSEFKTKKQSNKQEKEHPKPSMNEIGKLTFHCGIGCSWVFHCGFDSV